MCCGDDDAVAPIEFHEIPENGYLRLGITLSALEKFMTRIGWSPDIGPGDKYERNEEELGWVTKKYGTYDPDVAVLSDKPNNLTGYDFVAAVQAWLVKQRSPGLSVLEVLRKEHFVGVGKANTYYSHSLKPSPLGWTGTLARMKLALKTHARELPEDQTFFWLDILSLRQCELEKNFSLPMMMGAVEACRVTVIEVDHYLEVFTHLQCLFECYSALAVQRKLIINTYMVRDEARAVLRDKPINWEKAKALDKHYEDAARKYIDANRARRIEALVSDAVRKGARDEFITFGTDQGQGSDDSKTTNLSSNAFNNKKLKSW